MKLAIILFLLGCAGAGGFDFDALRLGGTMPVTAIDMWTSRSQVPRVYQHTVDWHGWDGPVNVVYSGRYVCVDLSDAAWALVQIGDRPAGCRWQSPRGV